MILDKLENASVYASISKNLKKGFEFLQSEDLKSIPPGRYDIDGNVVFALVSEYDSKNPEDCRLEAHRIYTDIQYLVSGKEMIGHELLFNQTITSEYNIEKDISFFEGQGTPLLIESGMFAVFFPQDVHRPCIKVDQSVAVKKVVIKLKL
jgi:YhcH/YjgK/YiaL family protein